MKGNGKSSGEYRTNPGGVKISDEVSLAVGKTAFAEAKILWRSLEHGGYVSPFQSYDWAKAWMQHFAPEAEPWLLVREGAKPTLLPLALRRVRGLRILTLLGHGPSDYLGPLPFNIEDRDASALSACISGLRSNFDLLHLRGWHSNENARSRFVAGLTGNTRVRPFEPCPYVDTRGTWNAFLESRSKKFRANLKRAARQVEQLGPHRIEREEANALLFDELVDVERESWKWDHGFSFLRDKRLRPFLRSLLLESSIAREVWALRVRGELAAFALVFPASRVRHYYLPSFRVRFPAAGSHLMRVIIEDSFKAEIDEFDFLQGDEAYKRPWATEQRVVYEVASSGRGFAGKAATGYLQARWSLARSRWVRDLRRTALVSCRRLRQRLGTGGRY